MKHYSTFQATLLSFGILSVLGNYDEIRSLNASCTPKDTCSLPRGLDHFDLHNCDCNSHCVLYDTCCIDSPFLNVTKQYERIPSCRPSGKPGESVFMVDACASSYVGPEEIRRRCEQTNKDWSDPLNHVPATNPKSLKTFKSLFCAICNDENPNDLVLWEILLDCSSLNEHMTMCIDNEAFVVSNIEYIHEKDVWGLWSWDSKSDWTFRSLALSYNVPDSIKNSVKECRPNLVSSCDPRWTHKTTMRLCKKYMAAVYFANATYRNIHCAICNFERSMTDMSCHDTSRSEYKSPGMNFGILLDYDLKDGNKVGTVKVKCGTNQVYDPFGKKCRTLECAIPGFILKNKKCVPEK